MATDVAEMEPALIEEGEHSLYEIVDGLRRDKLMGVYEVSLVSRLAHILGTFLDQHPLGWVHSEMLFHFGRPGQPQRRPDVSFVSYEKWPRSKKLTSENAWHVVPDLAVEVISRTNMANEVEEKVVEYLEAGIPLVWLVYPVTSRIYVFDDSSTIRVVKKTETLDGGAVLPGFSLPLASLFETETA